MAKPSFTWEDPFLLDSQLAADERQVRNAARDFAQKALQPRIRDAFRHNAAIASTRPFLDWSVKHSDILI